MAVSLNAELTNLARQRYVQMGVYGRAFKIERFVTGEGGHDPSNPIVALTPDRTVTELPLQTFGPKVITSSSEPTSFASRYVCTLLGAEAIGTLSNIGLIARIIYSPISGDPLLDTEFLYCVANMPMQVKLSGETKVFELNVYF